MELDNRITPVAGAEDFLLEAARRASSLYGYRPGTVEDWYYYHRFEFTREDPIVATGVQTFTFPMGGAADFEWHAIGCMASDVLDIDQPLPPIPTSGVLPSIQPPLRVADPGAEFDLAFFSLNGTRPHQNKPVVGTAFRGGAEPNDAGGWPPTFPLVERSWGLPLLFIEPTFISRNDSIRVDVTQWNNRSAVFPVASSVTFAIDVTLIGLRFYERRT